MECTLNKQAKKAALDVTCVTDISNQVRSEAPDEVAIDVECKCMLPESLSSSRVRRLLGTLATGLPLRWHLLGLQCHMLYSASIAAVLARHMFKCVLCCRQLQVLKMTLMLQKQIDILSKVQLGISVHTVGLAGKCPPCLQVVQLLTSHTSACV